MTWLALMLGLAHAQDPAWRDPTPQEEQQLAVFEQRRLDCRGSREVTTWNVESGWGAVGPTMGPSVVGQTGRGVAQDGLVSWKTVEMSWHLTQGRSLLTVAAFSTAAGDPATLEEVLRLERRAKLLGGALLGTGLAIAAGGTVTGLVVEPPDVGVIGTSVVVGLVPAVVGALLLRQRPRSTDPASEHYTLAEAEVWITSHNELLREALSLEPGLVSRYAPDCAELSPRGPRVLEGSIR